MISYCVSCINAAWFLSTASVSGLLVTFLVTDFGCRNHSTTVQIDHLINLQKVMMCRFGNLWPFKRNIYLFASHKQSYIKRSVFHLLVYFPVTTMSKAAPGLSQNLQLDLPWKWNRPKPSSHVLLLSWGHYQETTMELEQLEQELPHLYEMHTTHYRQLLY